MAALRTSLAPTRPLARGFATSALAREDARSITSDFLARLTKRPYVHPKGGRPDAPPPSGEFVEGAATEGVNTDGVIDGARGMIASVGSKGSWGLEKDPRKPFVPHEVTPPHAYTHPNLFPASRSFRIAPPLLGPPVKIARRIDPFYIRKSSPLEHTSNPLMSLAFLDSMGHIKSRAKTGLTWKSQRAVGKMVRRARAMGIIPRWSNMPRPKGLGHKDVRNNYYNQL